MGNCSSNDTEFNQLLSEYEVVSEMKDDIFGDIKLLQNF